MLKLDTVLVVDDEETMTRAISLMLKPARVVGTTDPQKALSLARVVQPQLALVDVYMPMVNGLDVVKQLRREFPGLVIGVMSGFMTNDLAMESIVASATWFVEKPFDKQKLLERLDQASARLVLPPPEDATGLQKLVLECAKWDHVQKVLAMADGNRSEAARILGIKRQSLQRMLRRGSPLTRRPSRRPAN